LYLAERLDGGIVDTEVLETGLNRIVRIATDDDPRAYVVRRPIKGRGDTGFDDTAAEHAVM